MSPPNTKLSARDVRLKAALDTLIERTPVDERIASDPVGMVHDYPPEDHEVVAHIAAVLAYGRVDLIRRAIDRVLQVLGPSPTEWVRNAARGDFVRAEPDFVYRMTRADDMDALIFALGELLRTHGRLEDAFLQGWSPDADDFSSALNVYVHKIRALGQSDSRGFRYLTPDPSKGGATKRWHLMLRWLVRPADGVDLGAWTRLPTRQLLLPVDRHIEQIVRHLGWTERATIDLRFVRGVSEQLRTLDSEDPMRYDFALCHMGISGDCLHRWEPEVCMKCPLREFCVKVPKNKRTSTA